MLAALLAAPVTGVPAPAQVRAQGLPEVPHITVDPVCGPVSANSDGESITVTVHGYSFQPAAVVALVWFGSRVASPGDAITVGQFGTFDIAVPVPISASPFGYQLDAYYADALATGGAPSATTYFNTPCPNPTPSISITPDCGDPGTTVPIHIDGSGFVPNLPIQARIVDLFGETTYASAPPAPLDPNAVSIDLQFPVPVAGQYRVIVDEVVTGEVFDFTPFTGTDYFVAPCSSLTVAPSCGPEGAAPDRYSLLLSGTGFQPLGLHIVFDPNGPLNPTGIDQQFAADVIVGPEGTWGPIEINPYARGPSQFDVVVTQSNDSPVLHETHATFTVPCSPGTVTLDPVCASPQFAGDEQRNFALKVQGFAFQPGLPVTVTFDPDGLSGAGYVPETAQGTAGPDGSFLAPMTILARPANTYRVSVQQQVGASVLDGVVPPFAVPCAPSSPTLNARPKCDPEAAGQPQAYSIRLLGRGFIPGFVELFFDADGTPEPFFASADKQGRFDTTIQPNGRPQGTYRIAAQQRDVNQALSMASFDAFKVPCTSDLATLTISPTMASPGFVVQVQGAGFPQGSTVDLAWSYGIGASHPIEVLVGADGTFVQQVLIFAHDFSGLRELTAGTPSNPQAFAQAKATLLVAPGQGQPPSYTIFDAGPMDPGSIVIRR